MFSGNSSLVIGGDQPTTGRVGGISLGGFVGPTFNPNGGNLAGLFESGFFDNVLSGIIRDNIASGTLGQDWENYQRNNPGVVNTSPVIGDNGQQIGSINQDLINDALKNLPQFGDYPVTQTGPTNGPQAPTQAPTQQAEQPQGNPSARPDESGRGQPSVGDLIGDGPIVGDGSGQVPDAPTNSNTGGNNNDTIPPWLKVILEGGNVSQTPTGADNEVPGGGFNNDLLKVLFGGLFGQQGNNSANANIFTDMFGDLSGGSVGDTSAQVGDTSAQIGDTSADNENTIKDLLSNVGNTTLNAGLSNYAADQQRDANKDAIEFQQGIYDDQINRLEPFRQMGLGGIDALSGAANSNPAFRDLFAGQQDINPNTNIQRSFNGQPLQAGNRSLDNLNPNVSYDRPDITSTNGLPSLQSGNRDVSSITDNVSYTDPRRVNTQDLPSLQAGNRDINLGDASQVGVNQINPLDRNDPYLQFLQDEQADVVQNSAAARGKLNSGGTLEALQDRAANVASNYMGQIQNISSAQDQARLASQGQQFGQQTTNAGLNNQFNQQDLSNASGIRSQQFNEGNQLFNQDVTAAGLQLGAQGQEFGQDLAKAGFNNSLNQQDFGNASQARSQLFGEGTTQFGQGAALAGLDLGAQGQQYSQGLQGNQFTNSLNQQDLSNSLGINDQLFSQDMQGAGFDLSQQQNNIANQFGLNSQLFGQNLGANQFDLTNDQNQYNQLFDFVRMGQNSAANQGAGAATLGANGGQLLSANGQIGAANTVGQGQNVGNFLAGLFS